MNKAFRNLASSGLIVAMALGAVGCETKAQTGALVGGAGGAALGAGIGSLSHSRSGAGALIGGAAGALGGYVIGNEMDKKDQRDREAAYQRNTHSARESGYNYEAPAQRLTQQDVVAWTDQGVKDEIIIDRIQQSGTVFRLTAADENRLRDANVSEEVIRAMKYTGR